jgi:hypothetical protein
MSGHFLALEQHITDRLEASVPEGVRVLTAVDMQSTIAPSVQVIFDGYSVSSEGGGYVVIRQKWLTVVCVRNNKTVREGVGMRSEAGPLIDTVLDAMHSLQVTGYTEIELADAPPPLYAGGFAYFPLAWTTLARRRRDISNP